MRDVVAQLEPGDRTALQVLYACAGLPMLDLGGRLTGLGLVDDRGLLTDAGRRVARHLVEATP